MNSQQAVLTALSCAGSLAALLVASHPAAAATTATTTQNADENLPVLTRAESNPITDALRCSCARCTLGEMAPSI
ncbi:MAG: hypothetical protein AAFQ74_10830 [Cyanobacteria bacterium J06623_4]